MNGTQNMQVCVHIHLYKYKRLWECRFRMYGPFLAYASDCPILHIIRKNRMS